MVKVRKKVFVFLAGDASRFVVTVKLPLSAQQVLQETWASPCGYGLGRSGWVTCAFQPGDEPPMERLLDCMAESYRAVAPKKLIKMVGQPVAAAPVEDRVPIDGAVLLIGADPLRLDRACRGLEERGAQTMAVALDEAAETASDGALSPDVTVVDIGRDAQQGLAVLEQIGPMLGEGVVIIAGVRNAKMERKLRAQTPTETILSASRRATRASSHWSLLRSAPDARTRRGHGSGHVGRPICFVVAGPTPVPEHRELPQQARGGDALYTAGR